MSPRSGQLHIGFVSRARGLEGEIGIRMFDRDSDTLLRVASVFLKLAEGGEQRFELVDCRPGPKELRVRLRGIESRTSAERLTGAGVYVDRSQLAELRPGEFFQADLVGLEAFTEDGRPLGRIAEIMNNGPVPTLIIRGEGDELMIPFADEFVPAVDLAQGRLVVRLPEYLD